jgi:predicted ATPase
MLKRLYIDNFRCFVNFEYKPERKQLLLGANGSGKSSLLDAVRLLKAFLRDGGSVDKENTRRAFQKSRTRWLDMPRQVFEIESELAGKTYAYRLELRSERTSSWANFEVLAERLKVNGELVAEISDGEMILYPIHAGNTAIRLEQPHIDQSLFRTIAARYTVETQTFLEWISNLNLLQPNPEEMERAERLPGRPRLASDMSNIADWYESQVKNDIEAAIRLSKSLKEAFEGFESLNFREAGPDRTELIVAFKGPKGSDDYRLRELSDGQRCLIALYMILHFLIAKGHTVFLDEPDNFVSLREIQPWLLAAEQATEDHNGQLILVSHHPEILNQWAQEYGLRFFREENGHVRTERFKTDPDGLLQPSELIARGWENE